MNGEYMRRAIELAKKGEGFTKSNPLVGAVIVKDNKVIGEGYHKYYGGAHAEINAITDAGRINLKDAEMYVTLEPCSHYGKTPPCAQAIVESGVKKVIIGMQDPNPLVAGNGIEILKKNGIEVEIGILEQEVKKLNEIFIKYITTKMPYCILKTAMTLDGKIATASGDSKWITNELSRKFVHSLRNKVSGIMVGIGTVLMDDPMLTTRIDDRKGTDASRIIVDSRGRIPLNAKVLTLDSNADTIIAVTKAADKNKIEEIKKTGAKIIVTPEKDNKVDLKFLMMKLGEMKIESILIEGGSELNYSALNEGIVDKINAFIAPKIIGGNNAKTSVGGEGKKYIKDAFQLENINVLRFGEDIMIEAYAKAFSKKGEEV